MRPEEIMVLDWFKFRYITMDKREITRIFRVSRIEDELGGRYYIWGDGFGRVCVPSKLEPIPITPEILEKNGFVFKGVGRARKPWQIIVGDTYTSWWKDRLVIRYKREEGHASNYLNVDCPHVHDLQHALRMAGIEKDITL